jgi:hypothetical protein
MSRATVTGCSPSHSPGCPPQTTSAAGRRNRGRDGTIAAPATGALGEGEAPDVYQHRAVAVRGQGAVELRLAVGDRLRATAFCGYDTAPADQPDAQASRPWGWGCQRPANVDLAT